MDWTAIIIAAITGGALATFIDRFFGKGKTKAETENQQAITIKLLQEISQSQLKMMQEQMASMQNRMDRLEADIEGRDMVIAELKAQIKDLQEQNEALEKQNKRLLKDNLDYGKQLDELRALLRALKDGQDDNPC